jgi:hypothetical protein
MYPFIYTMGGLLGLWLLVDMYRLCFKLCKL